MENFTSDRQISLTYICLCIQTYTKTHKHIHIALLVFSGRYEYHYDDYHCYMILMIIYDYNDDYNDEVDDDYDNDDDIYIMVKCLSVCNVFAYFIFSHFWAPLGLEISDPQLDR